MLTLIHVLHTGVVEANFIATVFITLASRIGSTVRKCPVTLFLIAGIFPKYRELVCIEPFIKSVQENHEMGLYYGREIGE